MSYTYSGKELELFEKATHWKGYLHDLIEPHLTGRILEVGAGKGSNTEFLCKPIHHQWVCLEPDRALAAEITTLIKKGKLPSKCMVINGNIDYLPSKLKFDSILYIDVLEHIKDDRLELSKASARLAPGGTLILLAPAHNLLFSPFDSAIGHFRRYDKNMLNEILPADLILNKTVYLDTIGLIASAANRYFLSSNKPTSAQIFYWDHFMVPLSRAIDPIFGFRLGKSIFSVLTKMN